MKKALILALVLLAFGFRAPETHKKLNAQTVANMQAYIAEMQKYLAEKPYKEVAGLIDYGAFVSVQIDHDLKEDSTGRK